MSERSNMFHPIRSLLAKFGYHKMKKVEKLTREDMERIRKNQPREYWDEFVLASPTLPPG